MPYIVHGETTKRRDYTIYDKYSYDYEYPDDLDLKPGSDFHNKLASKIYQRATESRTEISKRFPSWREVDRVLTTYIPTSDKEKTIKEKDSRRPVSIVFPYTYSMLEALLTYMTMAFFQDPLFQYEGVEDDDTIGGMLLELIVKLHCIKTKVPLALHTSFRDAFSYGVGIGLPGWLKIFGKVPKKAKVTTESDIGKGDLNFTNFVDDLIFEGNDLSNIDPYMWLPDPSVSSVHIQQGEFFGWIERDNYMNMLSEESYDKTVFNMKYVKHKMDKKSTLSRDQSERQTKFKGNANETRGMTTSTHPTDRINMYINLIPKDWKLGDSEYPEKWFFSLTADDIITSCHKANHYHGMYPAAVASPEFDGYSITPISRMEILYGLQGVLDFLFNSHVANVRKSINDMIVVDPYLVNIADLKDPEPGKLIRLRRPAWGHGVDKVVQQLVVQDITRANIADSAYITQWMDRISGADQSMQGSLRQGGPERLTRSEFQGTRGSAISRLQRLAMLIGMQYMQDIGTMFAVHTQQYMSRETYVKITGRYEEQLMKTFNRPRVRVTPSDISIAYDVIVRDGSVPGGNFSEAWINLFSTIAQTPELHQQFDVFRIFTYIAQQMGAKNVEDFKRVASQTNIVQQDDETVLREAERGNLVPIGG
jgi:hypothetical protein